MFDERMISSGGFASNIGEPRNHGIQSARARPPYRNPLPVAPLPPRMAGVYFHIPFCRNACVYCDFHFSTGTKGREAVIAAMHRELAQRITELDGAPLGSIYFGGGTPSILEHSALEELLRRVREHSTVEADAEITLETNPDDVSPAALDAWLGMGINRLSLGTQSFRDDRLRWMGRAHNARQAQDSIRWIAAAGFRSWTIDLIYGLPGMDLAEWDEQLAIALQHGMPHLSAYCLTVEERTALHHQVQQGRIVPAHDGQQAEQFQHLMARMEAAGLLQYEISNFGREGHFARHNTAYWQGTPYLGIGPSAHSYLHGKRRWNVAHNTRYVKGLAEGHPYWEEEVLTPAQRTNEQLLTGLRTMWGVALDTLPMDVRKESRAELERHLATGHLLLQEGHLVLSRAGRNFADRIASDLFILP